MKNKKINFTLISLAIATGAYIISDMVRTAKEKVFRIAAGESNYERTHKKK